MSIYYDFLSHSCIYIIRNSIVIIEVKDREVFGEAKYKRPTSESTWNVDYDGKIKDIKKQVQNQATALMQFCNNISPDRPAIKCWIVDMRGKAPDIIPAKQDSRISLLTFNGFIQKLNQINSVIKVEHSKFLRELRRGIISPDIGHPEIPNAIKFISTCRKSLDDQIFKFFQPRENYYAINGCAGMGKSVLLAYSIYVLASDHIASHVNVGDIELNSFQDDAKKIGLPDHRSRRIYAYAIKEKQIEALKIYWEKIKKWVSGINPIFAPGLSPPIFKIWAGKIPQDCNILVIDEAHDLSLNDQRIVADWVNQPGSSKKYLLVACDRNQAFKRKDSGEEYIIRGLNFTNHSKRLNRVYRCPFPVYVASIALLFGWFSPQGVAVPLSDDYLRGHFGFNPECKEENGHLLLEMRNDCHPGNNWKETVSFFKDCSTAFDHLSQFPLKPEQVLWVRFQEVEPVFDKTKISRIYTFVELNLSGPNVDVSELIDIYIKGQEFDIVLVEGLPSNMNPPGLLNTTLGGGQVSDAEQEMWKIRRNIYVICSRASAFLYFIYDFKESLSPDAKELKDLMYQVSSPDRGRHESGQTWRFKIKKPDISRNPRIFIDIKPEPPDPELKETRNIEFAGDLLVKHLARAFSIPVEKFQELLPQDAKAKNNLIYKVLLQEAQEVARKLKINFVWSPVKPKPIPNLQKGDIFKHKDLNQYYIYIRQVDQSIELITPDLQVKKFYPEFIERISDDDVDRLLTNNPILKNQLNYYNRNYRQVGGSKGPRGTIIRKGNKTSGTSQSDSTSGYHQSPKEVGQIVETRINQTDKEFRSKDIFPRGCTVNGSHYDSGNDAVKALVSMGKIRKGNVPTSSYNAHKWLKDNSSNFGFTYKRDLY